MSSSSYQPSRPSRSSKEDSVTVDRRRVLLNPLASSVCQGDSPVLNDPRKSPLSQSSYVQTVMDGIEKPRESVMSEPTPADGMKAAHDIFKSLREAYKRSKEAPSEKPRYDWYFKLPTISEVKALCKTAIKKLKKEPVLIDLDLPPYYIIGDIHGNFGDLYNFLNLNGLIHCGEYIPAKFIFLGDYIDRGFHDVECVLLLLCLKVLYPDKVYLLRGNHEWEEVTIDYEEGVLNHLVKYYGKDDGNTLFDEFMDVFSYLSVACVLNHKVLCLHGGIPRAFKQHPKMDVLMHFELMDKPIPGPEVTHMMNDIVFDAMWGDPVPEGGGKCVCDERLPDGFRTSARDGPGEVVACSFEMRALDEFLEKYKLKMLVRAHECMAEGCYVRNSCKMITVFSSSGYSQTNSAGALLYYDEKIRILNMTLNPVSDTPRSYGLADDDDDDDDSDDD